MIIKQLNKRIPQNIRSNTFCAKVLAGGYFLVSLIDRKFEKDLSDNISEYKASGVRFSTMKLRYDMMYAYARNQITPFEYRCFAFAEKKQEDRENYISAAELLKHFKGKGINFLPNDKYQRYLMFKDYFKRDIVFVSFENAKTDEQNFYAFKQKHHQAIIKPKMGTKGKGVQLVKLDEINTLADLSNLSNGACLIEELIVQKDDLAKFHPHSVNTLRFVSGMSSNGKFSYLYSLFRTGCGGSVVDNVGSGGIIALVDKEGYVCTDGMRGGFYFETHPDTRIKFKGFKMPNWDELLSIVENAHKSLPQQKLLGWDFAWSENGWDLVEVNPAPAFASFQILSNSGVKPLLKKTGII